MASNVQMLCEGRGQPTAPQVPVVVTCEAHYEAKQTRERLARQKVSIPRYAAGADQDYSLLMGELAFYYTDGAHDNKNNRSNYHASKVFTSFNNLPQHISKHYRFAGTVDKEFRVADGMDLPQSGDAAVTIRRAGTQTIVNTGNTRIRPGDRVIWRMPAALPGSGLPAVRVRGVSPTKFVAELDVLNYTNIVDMAVKYVMVKVKQVIDSFQTGKSDVVPALMADVPGVRTSEVVRQRLTSLTFIPSIQKAMLENKGASDDEIAARFAVEIALEEAQLLSERVIGIALQDAVKGKPFDILLGCC